MRSTDDLLVVLWIEREATPLFTYCQQVLHEGLRLRLR
jgi:hypothetical protein